MARAERSAVDCLLSLEEVEPDAALSHVYNMFASGLTQAESNSYMQAEVHEKMVNLLTDSKALACAVVSLLERRMKAQVDVVKLAAKHQKPLTRLSGATHAARRRPGPSKI